MASVIPLVIDSGRILCLDVGEEKESEIRSALAEVSPFTVANTKRELRVDTMYPPSPTSYLPWMA